MNKLSEQFIATIIRHYDVFPLISRPRFAESTDGSAPHLFPPSVRLVAGLLGHVREERLP